MQVRKITSLTALLTFILILLTSVVLYIVPQGRIAYWADWRLLGLSKEQWGNIHIVNGLLFLLTIFLHIYYNWKPIISYLKNKSKAIKVFTKEFNAALAVTLLFSFGILVEVPPFQWVTDLNGYIKDRAAVKYGEPPYGHAELSSLKTFAKKQGLDLNEGMSQLKKAGVRFENAKQTLKDIGRENDLSPQQVYSALKPKDPKSSLKSTSGPMPTGLGRMTVAQVADKYRLDPASVIQKLAENGIAVDQDEKMKAVAEKNNTTPIDLFEMMK